MSEDLHDIDDIFRKDIEAHREELPPAVWNALSNHLDKQQATYYQQKYKRLKRITMLAAGICFIVVLYVVTSQKRTQQTHNNNNLAVRPVAETTAVSTLPGKVPGVYNSNSATNQPANKAAKVDVNDTSLLNKTSTKPQSESIIPATNNPADKPVSAYRKTAADNETAAQPAPASKAAKSVLQTPPADANNPATAKEKITATENDDNKSTVVTYSNGQQSAHLKKTISKTKLLDIQLTDSDQGNEFPQSTGLLVSRQKAKKQLPATVAETVLTKSYSLPQLASSDDYRKAVTMLPQLPGNKNLISQTAAVADKHKRKGVHQFSLSAFATPNFNFSRLEDDHHFSRPGRGREDAHREEQTNISFSAGLLLSYQLSNRLRVQSGIGISSFSKSVNPKTIYAANDNSGRIRYELPFSYGNAYLSPKNMQLTVGDSTRTSVTSSRLTYVTIPLSLSYTIGKGRTTFYPAIGAGLNILTGSNAATSIGISGNKQSLSATVEGLRSSYLNGQIGFGAEYALSRRFSLGVQPNINFALTPVNRQTPLKAYQNFFSLQAALRVKL